jgi:hypothetical protein
MNYPNFTRDQRATPTIIVVAGHVPREALTLLNDLELRVIEIGFSADEPPFILKSRPARRLQWFSELVFGFRPKGPLANERLEALRAMAAAIRDAPSNPDERTAAAFVEAGWSRDDIRQIQKIAPSRPLAVVGRSPTLCHPFRASSTHPRGPVEISSAEAARMDSYMENTRTFVLVVPNLFAGSGCRSDVSRVA